MMSSVNQGAVLRSPVLRILTVVLKFSVLQASVFPISPVALLMTVQGGSPCIDRRCRVGSTCERDEECPPGLECAFR